MKDRRDASITGIVVCIKKSIKDQYIKDCKNMKPSDKNYFRIGRKPQRVLFPCLVHMMCDGKYLGSASARLVNVFRPEMLKPPTSGQGYHLVREGNPIKDYYVIAAPKLEEQFPKPFRGFRYFRR